VRIMPEKSNRLFGYLLYRPESIVIAVRPREDYDSKFHRRASRLVKIVRYVYRNVDLPLGLLQSIQLFCANC
jgi:hypothetical protein